jgi:hypothetical protein
VTDAFPIDDSFDNEVDNVSGTAQSSALMKTHASQSLHFPDKRPAIVRSVIGHEAAEYIPEAIMLDCIVNLASDFLTRMLPEYSFEAQEEGLALPGIIYLMLDLSLHS